MTDQTIFKNSKNQLNKCICCGCLFETNNPDKHYCNPECAQADEYKRNKELQLHMKLVGKKDNFEVYFDAAKQMYYVYYGNILIIKDKYTFADVKSYLD
jgi:predicted nucleic acid-binding Zn ribbon protein